MADEFLRLERNGAKVCGLLTVKLRIWVLVGVKLTMLVSLESPKNWVFRKAIVLREVIFESSGLECFTCEYLEGSMVMKR